MYAIPLQHLRTVVVAVQPNVGVALPRSNGAGRTFIYSFTLFPMVR